MACSAPRQFDFASMTSEVAPGLRALRSARQWAVFAGVAVVAVVIAHLLDEPTWRLLRDPRVYEKDLWRLFRLIGYLPVWLIVATALWMHDRPAPGWGWRGGLVLLSPMLGGAVAELLKLVVRRLRPVPEVFAYTFRSFTEDSWSTRGLGMPSSHALVAFAGAAALARVFPRSWWLWYLLATGCAVSRMLALGHFLSDTVIAALLGYVVGVLLARSGGFGRRLGSTK